MEIKCSSPSLSPQPGAPFSLRPGPQAHSSRPAPLCASLICRDCSQEIMAQVRRRGALRSCRAAGLSLLFACCLLTCHVSFVTRLARKGGKGAFLAGKVIYWEAAGYKHALSVCDCSPGHHAARSLLMGNQRSPSRQVQRRPSPGSPLLPSFASAGTQPR